MNRPPYPPGPYGDYYPPGNYYAPQQDYYSQPDYYAAEPSMGYHGQWNQPAPMPPLPPPPPTIPPPPVPPPPPPPMHRPRMRPHFEPAPSNSAMYGGHQHGTYYGSWDQQPMDMGYGGYAGSYDTYAQPPYNSGQQEWTQESDFVGDSWPVNGSGAYTSFVEPRWNGPSQRTPRKPPPTAPKPLFTPPSKNNNAPPKPETELEDKNQSQDMELETSTEAIEPAVVPKVEEEEDDDDWRYCKLCDVKFDNEQAYTRHSRGMMHTQKVLGGNSGPSTSSTSAAAPQKTVETPQRPESSTSGNASTSGSWAKPQRAPSNASGCLIDPDKRDLKPSELGKREDAYCEVCRITCSSEGAMQSHLEGKKHLKMLQTKNLIETELAVKPGVLRGSNAIPVNSKKRNSADPSNFQEPFVQRGESQSATDTGKPAFIQGKIDSFSEPLIGLRYLVEFVMTDFAEPRYVCNLCEAKCDPRTVISHLVGFKHRLRYMKEIRSDIYAEIQTAPSDGIAKTLIRERAAELDELEGRPKIRQKCETSLVGVIDNLKPHIYKETRVLDERHGASGPSKPRNEEIISRHPEDHVRPETPMSSADAAIVEKADFPYYSIRSSRGHVRVTDETDDFYVLEQGYYYLRREREHRHYDELYVKPFIGMKRKAGSSAGSESSTPAPAGPKMNDTLKLLMAALAKVSSGNSKNGEMTLALSTALTKALVKFKEAKKQADAQSAAEQKVEQETAPRPREPPVHAPAPLLPTPVHRPPSPEPYVLTVPYTGHRLALSPPRRPQQRVPYIDDELEGLLALHAQSQRRRAATAAMVADVPPPQKRKLGAGYNS